MESSAVDKVYAIQNFSETSYWWNAYYTWGVFWSELENTMVDFGIFGRTVKMTELLRSSCATKSIPCLCGQMNLPSWCRQSTGQRMGYLERKHF